MTSFKVSRGQSWNSEFHKVKFYYIQTNFLYFFAHDCNLLLDCEQPENSEPFRSEQKVHSYQVTLYQLNIANDRFFFRVLMIKIRYKKKCTSLPKDYQTMEKEENQTTKVFIQNYFCIISHCILIKLWSFWCTM